MNPVIFLWAHPRSMSTAIERVMRERGDLRCLHEPFLHYYYLHKVGKELPHFDSEQDHPCHYDDTRDMVLREAGVKPVFAKDMSYYVMPELLQDREFCRRLRHCFLVREPMRAILSYYRLDSGVSLEEIGIEQQWRQLEGLRELGIGDSLVLEAEAVQRDSVATMRRFWQALGLDDKPEALHWDSARQPQDWNYVAGWHGAVSSSSGIRHDPVQDDEVLRMEFEQASADAPQLSDYLAHHQPYYEKLRAYSLTREAHV